MESHPPDSGEALTPGAIAGLAVFLALFVGLPLLFAWRIGTAGIWIGREGIVVQGPLRTWTIPLEEAHVFSPGVQPGYGPNGTPCPMLTRDGGRPVGVWALGREGWVWRYDRYLSELEPLCDELNAVLRRVQEGAGIAERPGFRQRGGAPVASAR